jgi:hypothetical protein
MKEKKMKKTTLRRAAAALALLAAAAPAGATSLRRAGLEDLVAAHRTVLVGTVLDARSYWNEQRSFILTDVRVTPSEVLKGGAEDGDVTVTLLGGTLDGQTSIVVAGAELVAGRSYVLFVGEGDLPGARGVRTVPAHAQGVFAIVPGPDGEPRAVSEAADHPLVPDRAGATEVPGGAAGLRLSDLRRSVREIVERTAGAQEVIR